jgi:pSer/pThr/pTyr-binding forkhead associated (FHA) protein
VGAPSLVEDLGSTNGIVVDGQRTTRATLRDGSRIVVGSTTIIYRQAEG